MHGTNQQKLLVYVLVECHIAGDHVLVLRDFFAPLFHLLPLQLLKFQFLLLDLIEQQGVVLEGVVVPLQDPPVVADTVPVPHCHFTRCPQQHHRISRATN